MLIGLKGCIMMFTKKKVTCHNSFLFTDGLAASFNIRVYVDRLNEMDQPAHLEHL
jgi:hypothetical protein